MATAAPPAPPKPKDSTSGGGGSGLLRGRFGGGGGGGGEFIHESFPLSRYRTGIWVALAPIVMLFASLTSAYVVRQGLGEDWRPTTLPSVLWWNSLVLIASSITMEAARRKAKSQVASRRSQVESNRSHVESNWARAAGRRWQVAERGPQEEAADFGVHGSLPELRKWLVVTLLLGLGFLLGQIVAWRQLAARGIYLATNPSSSFFYLLTATHGVHLLGGIAGLAGVLTATWKKLTPGGRTGVAVASIYWHFMDGLWIYILLLLLVVP